MRATKIVATLGPSSATLEIIGRLAEAGVDVFRLNASHGTNEERADRVATIRRVERDIGRHVGILLDRRPDLVEVLSQRQKPAAFEIVRKDAHSHTTAASPHRNA